jgi:hypothetical protein
MVLSRLQHNIIKNYTCSDGIQRVERLRNIYGLMSTKNVPNVDKLLRHSGTTVVLTPRGIADLPKTERELVAALIYILEALKASK